MQGSTRVRAVMFLAEGLAFVVMLATSVLHFGETVSALVHWQRWEAMPC